MLNIIISPKVVVLEVLRTVKRSSYGLEIIKLAAEQSDDQIVLEQGTLYPLLKKLEAEGLIRLKRKKSRGAAGGRPREYYCLTSEGRQAAKSNRQIFAKFFGLTVPVKKRAS